MTDYALTLSEAEVARYSQMAEVARADELEIWEAAGVRPGARVADVGCGPGAISVALAQIVGPTGSVRAVDRDPDALATGRRLAAAAGLRNVRFAEGAADDTGLGAATMDVVMMRHVLAHNGGREQQIVDHIATLVRPGGSVYLVDIDADAMRVEPTFPELEELDEAYRELHARRGNDLSVGRRLDELLIAAGLESVELHDRSKTIIIESGLRPPAWAARQALIAEGLATSEDIARWGDTLDRLERMNVRFEVGLAQLCAFARRSS